MPASKRILLMYISEVSGHRSATLAIEKAIKIISLGSETLNINAFNYTNPISEKIVNRIYLSILKRAPKVWDYLYDNQKIAKKIEKMKESIHKFNSPKLKVLFDKFRPDVVICSQAFPCGMVADYKRAYGSNLPLIAVLTDYVPHSYWIHNEVDYFITPSDEVTKRLVNKGVKAEKIKTLGIPFDPDFNLPVSKKDVLEALNFSSSVPTVMIMGGGQGLGPIKTIVKSLERVKDELQEIIITGTNKKLYKSLKKKIKKYKKKIAIFSFINNIHELMSVSDILISKPGGITSAEAQAKGIPLIIVHPLPGQEANNTIFLMKCGAAIKVDRARDTYIIVDELLNNPDKIKIIRDSSLAIAKPKASMDIAKLALNF